MTQPFAAQRVPLAETVALPLSDDWFIRRFGDRVRMTYCCSEGHASQSDVSFVFGVEQSYDEAVATLTELHEKLHPECSGILKFRC